MRNAIPRRHPLLRTALLPVLVLAVLSGLLLGCPAGEDAGETRDEGTSAETAAPDVAQEGDARGRELDAMDHADPGHHDDEPHGGMVHGEAGLAGPVDHEAETDPDPIELDEVIEPVEEKETDGDGEEGGAEEEGEGSERP